MESILYKKNEVENLLKEYYENFADIDNISITCANDIYSINFHLKNIDNNSLLKKNVSKEELQKLIKEVLETTKNITIYKIDVHNNLDSYIEFDLNKLKER